MLEWKAMIRRTSLPEKVGDLVEYGELIHKKVVGLGKISWN